MLLWRCYLTPHPTITVQFVMTQALASLLMVMGIGLPMVAGASPMLGASLQYTITHYSSLSTDTNIPLGFNTTDSNLTLHQLKISAEHLELLPACGLLDNYWVSGLSKMERNGFETSLLFFCNVYLV